MDESVAEAADSDFLHVVDHPLVQHKLTKLRDIGTSTMKFRQLMTEIGLLLAYEATRGLKLENRTITTPICEMDSPVLAGKKMCFVSVLRAGEGLLHGLLDLVPSARVSHVGLARNPKTLMPEEYYFNAPQDMDERVCIVVDPMLATGGSAADAVSAIKARGAREIRMLAVLAAPEGIEAFHKQHPDVPVIVACVDEHLNDQGYIVPGLGDAGDRLFGTKVEH
jgi:uracil phosphoribosyltransferase